MRRTLIGILLGCLLAASAGCEAAHLGIHGAAPSPSPTGPIAVTATGRSAGTMEGVEPSLNESPTVIPDVQPSPTPDLNATPTIKIDPTYLYFLTITPTSTQQPYGADVRIYTPGPMSKVVTPIDLHALIKARLAGSTKVELFGEDGRLLYRKVLRTYSADGQDARVNLSVPFEVRAVAELGRLQITSLDSLGRADAVSSLHLLLLSSGQNQITQPADGQASVQLDTPRPGEKVSGGTIEVKGIMRPFNGDPVIVELVSPDGQAISSRLVALGAPSGHYQSFDATLPYRVATATEALLVVRQSDDRITGPFYLYSLPISLLP
jgi:hypothetical protein